MRQPNPFIEPTTGEYFKDSMDGRAGGFVRTASKPRTKPRPSRKVWKML